MAIHYPREEEPMVGLYPNDPVVGQLLKDPLSMIQRTRRVRIAWTVSRSGFRKSWPNVSKQRTKRGTRMWLHLARRAEPKGGPELGEGIPWASFPTGRCKTPFILVHADDLRVSQGPDRGPNKFPKIGSKQHYRKKNSG